MVYLNYLERGILIVFATFIGSVLVIKEDGGVATTVKP